MFCFNHCNSSIYFFRGSVHFYRVVCLVINLRPLEGKNFVSFVSRSPERSGRDFLFLVLQSFWNTKDTKCGTKNTKNFSGRGRCPACQAVYRGRMSREQSEGSAPSTELYVFPLYEL